MTTLNLNHGVFSPCSGGSCGGSPYPYHAHALEVPDWFRFPDMVSLALVTLPARQDQIAHGSIPTQGHGDHMVYLERPVNITTVPARPPVAQLYP